MCLWGLRALAIAMMLGCQSPPAAPARPEPARLASPAVAPSPVVVDAPAIAFGAPSAAPPAERGAAVEPGPSPARPTLASVGYRTFIWPGPKKGGRFLGYIRVGQRVGLRSTETVVGEDCPRGFYRIEPRGYVCRDRTVTLAESTPFLRANAHTLAKPGAFPYEFALSNGAPMYARLPTKTEQRRHEVQYGKAGSYLPLSMFQRGHEQLAVTDAIAPEDAIPPFLKGRQSARGPTLELIKRTVPHGSMLAYTRAFDAGGRTFLLSSDLTLVPADRVRRFRRSQFQGVELKGSTRLPLCFFRKTARPRLRRTAGGAFEPSGATFPAMSWVALGAESVTLGDKTYLKTTGGDWVLASDATVLRQRDKLPFGVRPGEKWMIVSIEGGTLVAYEDMTPVYATLVSPGLGGIPRKGGDPVKDSTTPLGSYRVTFKDRAATMSPQIGAVKRTFWIADVPFTQYFNPPFALHGTYWHESFGEPMSAGCVNASPRDAKWLFDWSDPKVPDGWQGATGSGAKENGKTTAFVVTR